MDSRISALEEEVKKLKERLEIQGKAIDINANVLRDIGIVTNALIKKVFTNEEAKTAVAEGYLEYFKGELGKSTAAAGSDPVRAGDSGQQLPDSKSD